MVVSFLMVSSFSITDCRRMANSQSAKVMSSVHTPFLYLPTGCFLGDVLVDVLVDVMGDVFCFAVFFPGGHLPLAKRSPCLQGRCFLVLEETFKATTGSFISPSSKSESESDSPSEIRLNPFGLGGHLPLGNRGPYVHFRCFFKPCWTNKTGGWELILYIQQVFYIGGHILVPYGNC